MQYKLIIFDIDGTILKDDRNLCQELIDLIPILKQKGYKITLASARFTPSTLRIARLLDLNHDSLIIALNGGVIATMSGLVVKSNTFSVDDELDYALQHTLATGVAASYYHEFDWYSNKKTVYTDAEIELLGFAYNPYDVLIKNKIAITGRVNKITLMGDHEGLLSCHRVLQQSYGLQPLFSHTNYLEVMPSDISKLHAIKYIARLSKIDMREIIAFGDGENDMLMLKHVGHGVAMANATQQVKAMARAVAGFHYDAGVANYLKQLLFAGVL